MRAIFRLLLILGLVWCALGVAEPGLAHAAVSAEVVDVGQLGDAPSDADRAGSAEHHHCPVAPDLREPAAAGRFTAEPPLLFVPRIVALLSLTRAPLLQPPAA